MAYRGDYSYDHFVQGSTVRKMNTVPQREQEEYQRPSRRIKPTRKKRPQSMDFFSFLVAGIAIGMTIYFCITYIQVVSNITYLSKNIVSLSSEVQDYQKQNDVSMETIRSEVDLTVVYQKATQELGMIHANGNQVYQYEDKKSDRVRQYADIPSK